MYRFVYIQVQWNDTTQGLIKLAHHYEIKDKIGMISITKKLNDCWTKQRGQNNIDLFSALSTSIPKTSTLR